MIVVNKEPLTQREVDTIVSWLNNPALMQYSEQRHTTHSQRSQLKYINSFKDPDRYYKLTVNDVLVGSISASVDSVNNIANVGILIGHEHTGKGHGCDAWRQFCQELAFWDIRKIESGCMAQNKPMIRIFEKAGMRLEGTRKYHFQTGVNQYDNLVMYGMLT